MLISIIIKNYVSAIKASFKECEIMSKMKTVAITMPTKCTF